MEYRFIRIIKTFIYISIFISFISGIILLFLKFDDDKTLIELHSSKVIFPLFVPFLIGTVCLYSSRRKNVSKFYIPVTLFIGSLLLFYFELAMFNLVGNYAFFYIISATFLLSSSVTSFIFEFKYKKHK
jgi:peptidoglycan/LPS O-acetylase OafA/YrhL